jgi:1,4-dihydroxy-2-naphthoate octaprenyltransferase
MNTIIVILGCLFLFVGGAMCHEIPLLRFLIAMILITAGTHMIHWG